MVAGQEPLLLIIKLLHAPLNFARLIFNVLLNDSTFFDNVFKLLAIRSHIEALRIQHNGVFFLRWI